MREFEYEELSKATKHFSNSQIIGKGSHGCIYKGSLEDGQVVAIKRWSLGLQNLQDNTKLDNEASILSSLPKTHHIVSLLGTSPDSIRSIRQINKVTSVAMLVMELIPNGTLHDLLHTNSHPSIILTWEKRVEIALQIARALQFLHTLKPKVIHRDIKSTNILLDNNFRPKLIDFGLAVRLDDVAVNRLPGRVNRVIPTTQPAGTIGYLDPSYTTPCMLSTKNDVFSFGVVLLEIITGEKVIDATRSTTSLIDWVVPLVEKREFSRIFDQKMTFSRFMEGVMMQVLDLAIRCVSSNVDDRPTSDEIVHKLENCYYSLLQGLRRPIWVKFISGFIILKRRRRERAMVSKKWENGVTSIKCVACQRDVIPHNNNEVSFRKLLLKDFLADMNDHLV
ncbi:serine/threonine-protein kinase-like protein At5g23170 [Silene latifolia]|uniref:serine/threonine-protein kinase-like protein At5g23170 n=1 Tax=Silene latifolia TaxID=37657 RepID=UPI003D78350E